MLRVKKERMELCDRTPRVFLPPDLVKVLIMNDEAREEFVMKFGEVSIGIYEDLEGVAYELEKPEGIEMTSSLGGVGFVKVIK